MGKETLILLSLFLTGATSLAASVPPASRITELPATPPLIEFEKYAFPEGEKSDSPKGVKSHTGTFAVVVFHRGKFVYERYAEGFGPDSRWQSWSVSKSFIGALIGIAAREGKLKLEDSICAHGFDKHCTIKIEHLMRWKSCLAWKEDYEKSESPAKSDVVQMLYGKGRDDVAAFAVNRVLECEPGSRFRYSSGDSNILSAILRNIYGADNVAAKLFAPLGITTGVWERDGKGTLVGSSYLYLSARDAVRLGRLYLDDGVFDGKRLLPEGWVKQTATPDPVGKNEGDGIGMHWWLGGGAMMAHGHWGQTIVVSPEHDAVAVRFGNSRDGSYRHAQFAELLSRVLPQNVSRKSAK